jgi:hypothetical protein
MANHILCLPYELFIPHILCHSFSLGVQLNGIIMGANPKKIAKTQKLS